MTDAKAVIKALKTLPNTEHIIAYINRFGLDQLPPGLRITVPERNKICKECLLKGQSWWDLNKEFGDKIKNGEILL